MKNFRGFALIAAFLILCSCLSAYGDGDEAGASGSAVPSAKRDVAIEDIAWNVGEGIIDGDRHAVFSVTNNSGCTIVGFELKFTEKADITPEQKAAYFEDLKTMLNIDMNDPDDAQDLEEPKAEKISMHIDSDALVHSGQTVGNIRLYYYSGIRYMDDLTHYGLVTPDIATVKYIRDGSIHTFCYDYSGKTYSDESTIEPARGYIRSGSCRTTA